ncbi:MAG: Holliday junction branch migration protein RuvA [Synechococcaceae cyanobacterium]|nr:Holliday junction branch migration protein RuvA [Synechococcaceae cyanobacterium]
MIGWLQGELADPWQQGSRCGLLLICSGVGYEVQLSQRHWQQLPAVGSQLQLHIHHSIREDGWTLFGFPQRQERDLFRELVSVSGVGPQMGLGLLGCLAAEELVLAIVQSDLRQLSQAPGVGRRTAERLAVELRQRLQERFAAWIVLPTEEEDPQLPLPPSAQRHDLQLTLAALGYESLEIQRALRAVAATGLAADAGDDAWIRDCLRWLSRGEA